jgi:hypothetical protein
LAMVEDPGAQVEVREHQQTVDDEFHVAFSLVKFVDKKQLNQKRVYCSMISRFCQAKFCCKYK